VPNDPLVLSTAIATFAAIGAASAQPFDMSRDQADRVTAGNGDFNVHVFKNVQEENLKLIEIKAKLESNPKIKGNFANAEAGATVKGFNTFTETNALSDAQAHRSSASFSEATSAATGPGHHR
jgi:hypothetical protein